MGFRPFKKQSEATSQVDADLEANNEPRPLGQGLPSEVVQVRRGVGDDQSDISVKQVALARLRWYRKLIDAGVEENGIRPVPLEKRIDTAYDNLFTVWFTDLLCVLP